MIINFNFDTSKVEFIWQQNNNKYFAVNFLMEHIASKNFSAIIEEVLASSPDIVEILKKEKNYAIIPDEVMGYGFLEIPSSRWNSQKYFSTKFDLLYNKDKNLINYNELMSSNKSLSTYFFASAKQSIISEIISTFAKYQIRIFGISFYGKVLTDYLIKTHPSLSKQNILILEKEENIKIYASALGKFVGYKKVDLSKNNQDFAKKYVKFIKNNVKINDFTKKDIDKQIYQTQPEEDVKFDFIQKIDFAICDFKSHFVNSAYDVEFNKLVLLNTIPDVTLEDDKVNIEKDEVKILSSYKKSYLYPQKKGLL